jgi:hypothetical protein
MAGATGTYLMEGGQFRRQGASIGGNFPNHLLNKGSRQAHFLADAPIYPDTRAVVNLASFRELVDIDLPDQPFVIEKRAFLCEENNPHPLTPNPYQDEMRTRQQVDDAGEEGVQLARIKAMRADQPIWYTHAIYIGALVVGAVSMLLIAAIVLPGIMTKYLG